MTFNNSHKTNNITFSDFYTNKIKNLSLRECLEIHYNLNPQFTIWSEYDAPEARNLIKSHDISHIIFGSDTSYMCEFIVQTWVKFGANLNISRKDTIKYLLNKDLRAIVLPEKLLNYALTHIIQFMKARKIVYKKAQLMTKKWEYFQEDNYMDKTIGEIRKEYNIVL